MIQSIDKTKEKITKLFTYGMLTLDPARHQFNFGKEEIVALENYRHYGFSWYPQCFYILPQKGYRVMGSVYEIDEHLLKRLDAYEDEAYSRKIVILPDNTKAWAYVATNMKRLRR